MPNSPLVSVVINNFNYGRYLPEAIESAIGQTYRQIEVIVVDDGSTDESLDVLRSYTDRVQIVTKENGGQASSLNAGFQSSHGEFVCFLDADDVLLPTALAEAVARTAEVPVAKVHWPLLEVDGSGRQTGGVRPSVALAHGDLRAMVVENGPESASYPPTSGNLWARSFLLRVFPLPEVDGYRLGGSDTYLSNLAPLYGAIGRVDEPQGLYRLHGGNNYSSLRFEQKLKQNLWGFEDSCRALAAHCRAAGIEPIVEEWRRRSWLYRFVRAREELAVLIPSGATVVLVDSNGVGPELVAAKSVVPFLERAGQYWGPPKDDQEAVSELNRLRSHDAGFVVFAWPAFWWLDHYTIFRDNLERRFRCILRNERVIAFDLRVETATRSGIGRDDRLSQTKTAAAPYTAEFFNSQKAAVRRSAKVVVPMVITALSPKSVVDVGCGNGTWLATFRENDVTDVLGVDGEYVDRDGLDIPGEQFLPFDLTKRLELDRQFDLVMSLEVAEHLPWSCADSFVESLTRLGSVVLFSAAVPHQGGTSHVNEQWPEFWAARFRKHGYVPVDFLRRQIWNHRDVVWWYAQNILLYVRSDSIPATLLTEAASTDASALSLVHPEGYLKAVGWDRRAREIVSDLEGAIRPGERFLWIDDEQLADAAGRPHDAVPFPRVRGEYWGPPEDGERAVVELERMRRDGVRFAVFTWPAFWWFNYYLELTEHLQASSQCVFKNDRLVIFEFP